MLGRHPVHPEQMTSDEIGANALEDEQALFSVSNLVHPEKANGVSTSATPSFG